MLPCLSVLHYEPALKPAGTHTHTHLHTHTLNRHEGNGSPCECVCVCVCVSMRVMALIVISCLLFSSSGWCLHLQYLSCRFSKYSRLLAQNLYGSAIMANITLTRLITENQQLKPSICSVVISCKTSYTQKI